MNDPTNSRYRYLSFQGDPQYRRFKQEKTNIRQSQVAKIAADIPAHGTYGSLLFRPEWRAKREEIINRDKSCVICASLDTLQVHHRQYHFVVRENTFKMPWDYPNNLLITLCEECHKRGHNRYVVPILNV